MGIFLLLFSHEVYAVCIDHYAANVHTDCVDAQWGIASCHSAESGYDTTYIDESLESDAMEVRSIIRAFGICFY